jgi:replication-associated recombination protein RarA
MILKAAELSLGKSNPIAYINAILSSWKNDGIFELDKIKQSESKTPNNGGESKKAIIERHYFDLRAAAERKAEKALNTAMADSIYGDIRKNLNSLSIQLAFAEVRDAALAKDISKQMAELEQKGDERLKAIGRRNITVPHVTIPAMIRTANSVNACWNL